MANGQQSSLQPVFQYSFPANNLFQISLVRDNDPNLPGYKKKHFCFLTLAPGEAGAQGGRTFNFTNKINLKQDVHKVLGLAHAFRAVARGQKAMIGNYSLFVDTSKSAYGAQGSGGVKQVFVNDYIKKPQGKQNDPNTPGERMVSLGFRIGQNQPVGLMFSVPDALACADVLEFVGKLGLRLEAQGSSVAFKAPDPVPNQNTATPPSGGPGSFDNQPPTGSPGQQGFTNNPPSPSGPAGPSGGDPNEVAQNFEQGLSNAATFPGTPPGMGDDDIPF